MSGAELNQLAPATQSERGLVGALLQDYYGIMPICQSKGVTGSSFTDTDCIRAWRTLELVRSSGKMVVLDIVMDAAGEDGPDVFGRLVSDWRPTAFPEALADEVKLAERGRELHAAARLAQERLENGGSVDVVAAQIREAGEVAAGGHNEPQIVSASEFTATPLHEPPQVIHGVIRAGQVGLMAASSKAGKSWALLALGIAVARGLDWLGWQTTQGRVLYVNAELPRYDLHRRLERLAEALGLDGRPEGLDILHLRGTSMTIRQLVPTILRRQGKTGPYSLILPDPLYAFGGGRDENSNSEQAKTMAELSELAEQSSAAVWIAHHFSKGNKAQTDHLDRASGAGMYARAVDVFATLTRHNQDDCYSVETTCRSFQRPEPFVVRWEYPLWRIEADLDPNDLKQQPKSGRPSRFTPRSIAELLPDAGMKYSELQRLAECSLGVKESRFAQLLKLAKAGGLVRQDFGMYFRGGVGP